MNNLPELSEFRLKVQKNLAAIPPLPPTAFVAGSADLSGQVFLGERANVWYGAVLRGDIEPIIVGEDTNIQDLAVIHTAGNLPCRIGSRCTIGHSAILHACTIGDECLIGMGAILLDGSRIGSQCLIGAGALVTQHVEIPAGSLVLGSPGKVVRPLTTAERDGIRQSAEHYLILAEEHRARTTVSSRPAP